MASSALPAEGSNLTDTVEFDSDFEDVGLSEFFYFGLAILLIWMLVIIVLVRHYWLDCVINTCRRICCGKSLQNRRMGSGLLDATADTGSPGPELTTLQKEQ